MEENSGKANVLNKMEKPVRRRRRRAHWKRDFSSAFASSNIMKSNLSIYTVCHLAQADKAG